MLLDLPPHLRHSRQHRQVFFHERVDRPCPVCGNDVVFEPRAIGVVCGHCHSPLHRQPDDDAPLAPTAVQPFRVSEAEACARILEAAGRPPLRDPGQLPGVRRMYAPYWRFTAHVVASWVLRTHDGDDYERKTGGFTGDYDEALPAAVFDGEFEALADFTPQHLAEASAYEAAQLHGMLVLPPTIAVANAWSDMRGKWEARIQRRMRRESGGSLFVPTEITESSSDFSQERGALVYVPVYVADRGTGMTEGPVVIDGYSGEVIRPQRRRATSDAEAAAAVVQVPEAMIGVGVLVVIAIVVLALALWVVRQLYWL